MNNEQFESALRMLKDEGYPPLAHELRARDTAQREALARVEAERDAVLAKAPTQWAYDQACRTLHKHRELANTAQALLREVDAYLSGHSDNAICNGSRLHRDIKDLLAGQRAIAGTTSDQYRAELYDEVWEKARDMGYGNVTDALVALERMKADHEANGLEYGEALILIGQVLDCRSLEDLNAVRRYLNEFMDRYSLRPVPDVDLAQAEQQEAQGAQAGMCLPEMPVIQERRPYDEYLFGPDVLEGDGDWADNNLGAIAWLADNHCAIRAALATQPAAIKLPPAPYVGPEGGYEFSSYEQGELQGRCDMWELIRKMNTPPAAAPVAAGEPQTNAKQLAASLKLVRSWERPGQATEWEFGVPGSFNRHVVAASEQIARAIVAQDIRREGSPAAAHGDEAVDQLARKLFAAFAKAEPGHPIALNPASYWATFADMARAAMRAQGNGGSS